MSIRDDIEVTSKHVPWGGASGEEDFIWTGEDWSGAAFVMAIGRPGEAPLITLTNAAAGAQGISATYIASYLRPDKVVSTATQIRPQIDEATLEALSWGTTPLSDPLQLQYDLLVTPAGGTQRQIFYGAFTIRPGVGD